MRLLTGYLIKFLILLTSHNRLQKFRVCLITECAIEVNKYGNSSIIFCFWETRVFMSTSFTKYYMQLTSISSNPVWWSNSMHELSKVCICCEKIDLLMPDDTFLMICLFFPRRLSKYLTASQILIRYMQLQHCTISIGMTTTWGSRSNSGQNHFC